MDKVTLSFHNGRNAVRPMLIERYANRLNRKNCIRYIYLDMLETQIKYLVKNNETNQSFSHHIYSNC